MAESTHASATCDAPTLLDLMFRDSGLAVNSHGGPSPSPPSSTPSSPSPKKKDDPNFGKGLRRGFFLDCGPNKSKQDPTIPTIKRAPSKSLSLVLPEVRAAMDREAEEAEAQRARALPPAFQALLGRGGTYMGCGCVVLNRFGWICMFILGLIDHSRALHRLDDPRPAAADPGEPGAAPGYVKSKDTQSKTSEGTIPTWI